MKYNINKIYNQYTKNKNEKTGNEIICPICEKHFIKKQYSQAFCNTKCKDKFHNLLGDIHKYEYYKNHNYIHNRDFNNYDDDDEIYMSDHDWDETFEVAEYND